MFISFRTLATLVLVLVFGAGCSGAQTPKERDDIAGEELLLDEEKRGAEPEARTAGWNDEYTGGHRSSSQEHIWSRHRTAEIPVSDEDPMWGDPLAPVTIVEFADLECPYCARVAPTLEAIRLRYGREQVRLVWKNNPLPFHKSALPAQEAAMVAFDLLGNEGFWGFVDAAFANQGELNQDSFIEWAAELGVHPGQFSAALSNRRYGDKIQRDIKLAREVGALGTPTFRINGVELAGAQPLEKGAVPGRSSNSTFQAEFIF